MLAIATSLGDHCDKLAIDFIHSIHVHSRTIYIIMNTNYAYANYSQAIYCAPPQRSIQLSSVHQLNHGILSLDYTSSRPYNILTQVNSVHDNASEASGLHSSPQCLLLWCGMESITVRKLHKQIH